eukprot:c12222_g1_i5.p1 GENE.c12222_g1_i5~~c12222_g1_i5.p1  ORF type:complete len:168 (-),score=34.28 c12222_g1_i5:22-486(-)
MTHNTHIFPTHNTQIAHKAHKSHTNKQNKTPTKQISALFLTPQISHQTNHNCLNIDYLPLSLEGLARVKSMDQSLNCTSLSTCNLFHLLCGNITFHSTKVENCSDKTQAFVVIFSETESVHNFLSIQVEGCFGKDAAVCIKDRVLVSKHGSPLC